MRRITRDPELFRPRHLGYKRAGELAAIDRILVANPQAAELVWNDLQGRVAKTGRPGLSADQVLQAAIIKQIYGFSYEDLAFHLADSQTYRNFCGYYLAEEAPKKSALAQNIKQVKAETWEKINRILLDYAKEEGLEDGLRVRIDATVTETNIHPPTDNKLLFDCVRVFDRLLSARAICRRLRRASKCIRRTSLVLNMGIRQAATATSFFGWNRRRSNVTAQAIARACRPAMTFRQNAATQSGNEPKGGCVDSGIGGCVVSGIGGRVHPEYSPE